MKFAITLVVALAVMPLPATAQTTRDVPAGSPLGATPGTNAQAVLDLQAQQARLQAAARARANAQAMAEAFASPPAAAIEDEARARPTASTFGGPETAAAASRAPSPYGGYYQIRTPWDRR